MLIVGAKGAILIAKENLLSAHLPAVDNDQLRIHSGEPDNYDLIVKSWHIKCFCTLVFCCLLFSFSFCEELCEDVGV